MSRRLSSIALLSAAALLMAAAPASAVGPFGPAEVVIGGCTDGHGDAAIATGGTTRGFANCTDFSSGRIWFFRDDPGGAPFREGTPYTGVVLSVAWDGLDSTYVVFWYGTELRIGKRIDSSGVYAAPTTLTTRASGLADLVASAGRWWAVWSEVAGSGDQRQSELFQRRTLLGVQGRTRITTTAPNVNDDDPTLAYGGGRVTMVWTRTVESEPPQPQLRIAESTGGAWHSRPFAWLGDRNYDPDVTVYAGVTWVTWVRGWDDRVAVAHNSGGTFHSRTFATTGSGPTVAVSGDHAFVAWSAGAYPDHRAFVAELSGGAWTGTQVAEPQSYPLRVTAQGTRARVVYQDRAPQELRIRTQT